MGNVSVWFPFPGDIGGQMGLFIGASILTILEILDYIYEVFHYITKRCKHAHITLYIILSSSL